MAGVFSARALRICTKAISIEHLRNCSDLCRRIGPGVNEGDRPRAGKTLSQAPARGAIVALDPWRARALGADVVWPGDRSARFVAGANAVGMAILEVGDVPEALADENQGLVECYWPWGLPAGSMPTPVLLRVSEHEGEAVVAALAEQARRRLPARGTMLASAEEPRVRADGEERFQVLPSLHLPPLVRGWLFHAKQAAGRRGEALPVYAPREA